VLFAMIFNSVTPIIEPTEIHHDLSLPRIILTSDDGFLYVGNMTTFSWGRDFAFTQNVSDSFDYAEENGEATISLEKGAIISFIARDYHDSNATGITHRLPVAVYVYRYPSNSFEGILEEIHGPGKNQSSFLVDMIDEGDYYLRVNHQNPKEGGGSVSYYFKVRLT
jgi:hypothetical protein